MVFLAEQLVSFKNFQGMLEKKTLRRADFLWSGVSLASAALSSAILALMRSWLAK